MTMELLHSKFASIHQKAVACGENVKEIEAYRRDVKYNVIHPLVEEYKKVHPDVSWGDSYLAVRDAYKEYVGTLFPREGITARPIPGVNFESKQTPILDDEGKFHCCYRRNKKGLPAFKRHTCTLDEKELINWFHHSSPVPYEVTDKEERRRLTIQNLQQLAAQDPGRPVAEVRLLSPLTGVIATLASPFAPKYFTELNDYDQLLETAIAAELSGLNITLFNFGVNTGRYVNNELQTQLNIRALKKLYAKITGTALPSAFELDLNDPNVEQSFLVQLANQNSETYAALPQNIDGAVATKRQKELFKRLMGLLSSGDWKESKNNFMAQAILVILLHSFGYLTATGCNDAKDRDGELTNYIEALLVYINTKGLPFEKILGQIRENSTAKKVAEEISMPGAKGLDIKSNPKRKISGLFKHLFTETQYESFRQMDEDVAAKKGWWNKLCKFASAIKNYLARFFTSILLAVGLMSIAQAATPTTQDGASSIGGDSGYSVPLTGDQTPSVPQPASKRDDTSAIDDAISEDEDEHSSNSSPKSSPQLSRKSLQDEDNPVKSWKDLVRQRGDTTGMTTVEKVRLMGITLSKQGDKPLSVSQVAEEEQGKITRRNTY